MVTILRPLSTSELLDRTFHLYRNNFVVFVAIVAIPQLAVLALQLLLAGTVLSGVPRMLGLYTLPISILSIICGGVSQAATIYAVSNVHLDRPVQIGNAFRNIAKDVLRVVWVTFAVSIIIGFGLVLLIVPGIYWALKYAVAIPATVLEGGGLSESTSRSSHLTEDNRSRIFVIWLLFTVLTWVVSLCMQYALGLRGPLFGRHAVPGFTATRFTLLAISGFLTHTFVGPLLTIAMTLVYYDERVRKEGFDLQLMVSTLEGTAPSMAAAPAS